MTLALRTSADPAPTLDPLDGMTVERVTDLALLAELQRRPVDALAARLADGHRAYLARVHRAPAAFGWVATRTALIGELRLKVTLPAGARYLWNFVTLPGHRGRGIYPRLLDAIVRSEPTGVERWWVAAAPENHASGAGIRKAGFTLVAELSLTPSGTAAVHGLVPGGGAAAAAFLAVPEAPTPLAPCWHCGRVRGLTGACGRGPGCTCDYQRPEQGCHAA